MKNSRTYQKLDTPLLLLVFNRLETTKKVFEQIQKAKPSRLYIASDGARKHIKNEDLKVNEIREYILENIDWDCDIKTKFHDHNLGCKYSVSSSISWFFKHEPKGIILEDDCFPSASFFDFCQKMLETYEDDKRIWHITGSNFHNGLSFGDGSYYFSNYSYVWGWATWADRWQNYDVEMSKYQELKKNGLLNQLFDKKEFRFWLPIYEGTSKGEIDTWDYQWTFTILMNNGLSIIPNNNMISNIGFGNDATHTFNKKSKFSNISLDPSSNNLIHPSCIIRHKEADSKSFRNILEEMNYKQRIKFFLKNII